MVDFLGICPFLAWRFSLGAQWILLIFFWQKELQFALHFERGGEGRMDGEAGLWCQKLLLIATRMVDRSTKMQFCILRYNRIAYVGMFVICFNVLCLNFRSSYSLLFNMQQKVMFCKQTILLYWLLLILIEMLTMIVFDILGYLPWYSSQSHPKPPPFNAALYS